MSVCEYGVSKINSIFCNLIKDNCTFARWCYNDQCIKNTEGYKNCKVRSTGMARRKVIETNSIDEIKTDLTDESVRVKFETENIKSNTRECPVILIIENGLVVNFDGHGLLLKVDNTNVKIGDFVTVKYQSDIGKPDFEYNIKED